MAIIWNAEVTGLHKGRAFAISTGVCALPWKDKAIFIVSIRYSFIDLGSKILPMEVFL